MSVYGPFTFIYVAITARLRLFTYHLPVFTGRFTSDYDLFTAIYLAYAAYLRSICGLFTLVKPGMRAAPRSRAYSKTCVCMRLIIECEACKRYDTYK